MAALDLPGSHFCFITLSLYFCITPVETANPFI